MGEQLVEVEDRRFGLVERLGSLRPELVRLPDLVDQLRDPPIDPLLLAGGRGGLEPFLQEIGQIAELGQDRAPGCLRRVGGEDRSDLQTGEDAGNDLRIEPRFEDPVDRGLERTLALDARQFSDPVGLLGDVG